MDQLLTSFTQWGLSLPAGAFSGRLEPAAQLLFAENFTSLALSPAAVPANVRRQSGGGVFFFCGFDSVEGEFAWHAGECISGDGSGIGFDRPLHGGELLIRSVEAAAQEAKIAELKRLITSLKSEPLEKLEDAVDAFLWSEEDEHEELARRTIKPR